MTANYLKPFTSKKTIEELCKSCKYEDKNYQILCGMCKKLGSNDFATNNYFTIFNLNQGYKIDHKALNRNYKELQKLVHPDKYLLNDQEILDEAQKCSSIISNAYNILKDDFERANYLLKLKQYKFIEEGNENVYDPEYLEILLEVQEEIQEAENTEQLNHVKTKIIDKLNDIKSKVESGFEANKLEDVYEMLKLMKFYLSLLTQAENRQF